MTPDELRALADAATPGPWVAITVPGAANWWVDGPPPVWGENDARLIALAPSLAREVADLREWAERSVELLNIGLPPAEHAHIVSAFTGEMGGRCGTCDIYALLAEYAERWGNT